MVYIESYFDVQLNENRSQTESVLLYLNILKQNFNININLESIRHKKMISIRVVFAPY